MLLKYRYYSITLTYDKNKAFDCKLSEKSQRGIEPANIRKREGRKAPAAVTAAKNLRADIVE